MIRGLRSPSALDFFSRESFLFPSQKGGDEKADLWSGYKFDSYCNKGNNSYYRELAYENETFTDVLLSAACMRSGFPDLSQNSDFSSSIIFC
jgi:hypothetical protein